MACQFRGEWTDRCLIRARADDIFRGLATIGETVVADDSGLVFGPLHNPANLLYERSAGCLRWGTTN